MAKAQPRRQQRGAGRADDAGPAAGPPAPESVSEVFGSAHVPQVPADWNPTAPVEAPPPGEEIELDLTDFGEEWQNVDEMPSKEARPGRQDPALQQALDAFAGAKLPR